MIFYSLSLWSLHKRDARPYLYATYLEANRRTDLNKQIERAEEIAYEFQGPVLMFESITRLHRIVGLEYIPEPIRVVFEDFGSRMSKAPDLPTPKKRYTWTTASLQESDLQHIEQMEFEVIDTRSKTTVIDRSFVYAPNWHSLSVLYSLNQVKRPEGIRIIGNDKVIINDEWQTIDDWYEALSEAEQALLNIKRHQNWIGDVSGHPVMANYNDWRFHGSKGTYLLSRAKRLKDFFGNVAMEAQNGRASMDGDEATMLLEFHQFLVDFVEKWDKE